MISKEQMELYIKLDGDVDSYQTLVGKLKDNEKLADSDWSLVDDLYQRLVVRKNKLESEGYGKQTDILLKRNFPNEEVKGLFHDYYLGIKAESPWWQFWK